MITPTFSATQTDEHLMLRVECPLLSKHIDTHHLNNNFKLNCHPYFLNLYFSHNLNNDRDPTYAYDFNTSILTITLEKEVPGQVFNDLDLTTTLMAPSMKHPAKNLIVEEIGENTVQMEEDAEYLWSLASDKPNDPLLLPNQDKHGFNNQYTGLANQIHALAHDILELNHPTSDIAEKFDEDAYMMDFINDSEIQECLKFKPVFYKLFKQQQNGQEQMQVFTEDEKKQMSKLQNKTYLIDNPKIIYLSLVDILFAYCYNFRINMGEPSVETPWNICKLSSTLCCFQTFQTLPHLLHSSIKRSLTYPLYRNFALALKCIQDLRIILLLGKKYVLKVLLNIQQEFAKNDALFCLNKVWVDDYCVWIQRASDTVLKSLALEIQALQIEKKDIDGFMLEQYEELAIEIQNEENLETQDTLEEQTHRQLFLDDIIQQEIVQQQKNKSGPASAAAFIQVLNETIDLHGDEKDDQVDGDEINEMVSTAESNKKPETTILLDNFIKNDGMQQDEELMEILPTTTKKPLIQVLNEE